jgi:hypothetical protein
MTVDARQVKFRLTDEELREVEAAAGTGSVPALCKRLVLECVRGERPLKPRPADGRTPASAEARGGVRPIPKGKR